MSRPDELPPAVGKWDKRKAVKLCLYAALHKSVGKGRKSIFPRLRNPFLGVACKSCCSIIGAHRRDWLSERQLVAEKGRDDICKHQRCESLGLEQHRFVATSREQDSILDELLCSSQFFCWEQKRPHWYVAVISTCSLVLAINDQHWLETSGVNW